MRIRDALAASSMNEDNVMAGAKTAYGFDFTSLKGEPLPLRQFAGRPMVIVNTASKCGFTPQYAGLQALWERYKDRGLVMLGVPSNDFANQEPGGSAEIASFCAINYGVDFPMTGKVHVRGPEAHPLFQWLAAQGGPISPRPRWNFFKYLIDRKGGLATWFSSLTAPQTSRFTRALDDLMR
jgi:glutathione peroxidase